MRPGPSARRPLTWRAGARRAEPAGARGGGCGAASTKRGPSPAGAEGRGARPGWEGRGPRPARDPAPATAYVRREGRGLFVSARRGRRARPSPGWFPGRAPGPRFLRLGTSGVSGVSGPRRDGLGPGSALPSPAGPLASASGAPWTLGAGRGVWVPGSPALRVSRGVSACLCPPHARSLPPPRGPPLAGARFHGEGPGRRRSLETREARGACSGPYRAPHPPPRAPARGPPFALRVCRPLARLPAGRGAGHDAPGCGAAGTGLAMSAGCAPRRRLGLAGASPFPRTSCGVGTG